MMAKPNEISTFPLDSKGKRLGNSVFSNGIADFTSGEGIISRNMAVIPNRIDTFQQIWHFTDGKNALPKSEWITKTIALDCHTIMKYTSPKAKPSKNFSKTAWI